MIGTLMYCIGSPFVAPADGPFLKTIGLSYEDCIQWQISIVEAYEVCYLLSYVCKFGG